MDKNELTFSINQDFFQSISNILEEARRNAKTAVNLSMVYAYYEIGRKIVEEEKGYSAENLKLMRRFYMVYSQDQIGGGVTRRLFRN